MQLPTERYRERESGRKREKREKKRGEKERDPL